MSPTLTTKQSRRYLRGVGGRGCNGLVEVEVAVREVAKEETEEREVEFHGGCTKEAARRRKQTR